MTNNIKKFMDSFSEREEKLLQFSGGNPKVLKDKEYLRVKHRETKAFLASNKKNLTGEEKIWRTVLRAGNRHLEKELYPNRFVRYFQRALNAVTASWKARRAARWEAAMQPADIKNYPMAAPKVVKASSGAKRSFANEQKPLTRIVPKNKYATIEHLKANKGLFIKH